MHLLPLHFVFALQVPFSYIRSVIFILANAIALQSVAGWKICKSQCQFKSILVLCRQLFKAIFCMSGNLAKIATLGFILDPKLPRVFSNGAIISSSASLFHHILEPSISCT